MNISIIYPSAGEFWQKQSFYKLDTVADFPENNYCPSAPECREIAAMLGISLPLTLATYNVNQRKKNSGSVVRLQTVPFLRNSFVRYKKGQYDIYVARPELCFLQARKELDFLDSILFGTALCARYYADFDSEFSQKNRSLLTTQEKISDYLASAGSGRYTSLAAAAARYILNNSNSPMESSLGIAASLPLSKGGYGLGRPEMNYAITVPEDSARLLSYNTLHVDMAWPNKMLAVEYNSNMVHLSSSQMAHDFNRMTALNHCGYRVIAVTSKNIADFQSLELIMGELRYHLRLRSKTAELEKYSELRHSVAARLFNWSGNGC